MSTSADTDVVIKPLAHMRSMGYSTWFVSVCLVALISTLTQASVKHGTQRQMGYLSEVHFARNIYGTYKHLTFITSVRMYQSWAAKKCKEHVPTVLREEPSTFPQGAILLMVWLS